MLKSSGAEDTPGAPLYSRDTGGFDSEYTILFDPDEYALGEENPWLGSGATNVLESSDKNDLMMGPWVPFLLLLAIESILIL